MESKSEAKPDPIVIGAYLDDVVDDLEAVRRLALAPASRHAAFHLQQAAEKLVKAVRLHRGLFATADHQIDALLGDLTGDDPWRTKLSLLGSLSVYATAFRYPSPTGRRKPGPSASELNQWIEVIAALVVEARASLLPRGSS
jgi:HEPN domain-containing protein